MSENETYEVIITIDKDEQEADIYCAWSVWWKRLEKKGLRAYEETTCKGETTSKSFKVPRIWIKVNKPRVLTQKQKEHLIDRLKVSREQKKIK